MKKLILSFCTLGLLVACHTRTVAEVEQSLKQSMNDDGKTQGYTVDSVHLELTSTDHYDGWAIVKDLDGFIQKNHVQLDSHGSNYDWRNKDIIPNQSKEAIDFLKKDVDSVWHSHVDRVVLKRTALDTYEGDFSLINPDPLDTIKYGHFIAFIRDERDSINYRPLTQKPASLN